MGLIRSMTAKQWCSHGKAFQGMGFAFNYLKLISPYLIWPPVEKWTFFYSSLHCLRCNENHKESLKTGVRGCHTCYQHRSTDNKASFVLSSTLRAAAMCILVDFIPFCWCHTVVGKGDIERASRLLLAQKSSVYVTRAANIGFPIVH